MTAAPKVAAPHVETHQILATRAVEPTPMLKFGFICFCIFNLAVYSRFFEWKFYQLHVPLITSTLALMGAALDGRLMHMFRTRIGFCFGCLTMLYAANIPFSSYRHASFDTFTGQWVKSVIAFLIAGALIVTFRQCRTALSTVGWGSGIAGLLVLALGRSSSADGRLSMGRGTLGNSNELASILLLGMPFLWLMVTSKDKNKLIRLVALGLTGTSVLALFRTGSRTGLIGLSLLILLYFLRTSFMGKIVICVGVSATALIMFSAFPLVTARYSTLITGNVAVNEAHTAEEAVSIASAEGSAEARRALLVHSLEATVTHPLMGVGIGAFGAYRAALDAEAGRRPNFQGTHNTYTQISAEAGIPALILFLAVMYTVFSGLLKTYKRARKSPTETGKRVCDVSFALLACLAVYAFYIFFDYVAYESTLPTLAGFAIALSEAAGLALTDAEKSAGERNLPQVISFPVWQGRKVQPAAQ